MNTISKMMTTLFEDIEDNSMILMIEKNEEKSELAKHIRDLYADADVAAKFKDPSTVIDDKETRIKNIESGSGLNTLKIDTLKQLDSTLAAIKTQVDDEREQAKIKEQQNQERFNKLKSQINNTLQQAVTDRDLYELFNNRGLTFDELDKKTTYDELVAMLRAIQDASAEYKKANADKDTADAIKAKSVTDAQRDLIKQIKRAYIRNGVSDFTKANLIPDFKYKFDTTTPDDVSNAEINQFADAIGDKAEKDGNAKLNAVLKDISDPKTPNTSLFKAHVAVNKKIADIVSSEKDFSKFSDIAGIGDEDSFKNAINNNTWDKTPAEKIKILNDMSQHKATNAQVDAELDAKRTEWDLYVVPLSYLKFPSEKSTKEK